MTNTTKQAECNPEKICVRFCEFDGIKMAKKTHPKSSEYIRADLLIPVQEKPFAWATFDGEGGYDLRLYEDNENYRKDYIELNGAKYESWVKPLYEHPAPVNVLTDELKAELLGGLSVALAYVSAVCYNTQNPKKRNNYADAASKIRATFDKLNALEGK